MSSGESQNARSSKSLLRLFVKSKRAIFCMSGAQDGSWSIVTVLVPGILHKGRGVLVESLVCRVTKYFFNTITEFPTLSPQPKLSKYTVI
jgi:hypothetical protein